MAEGRSNQHAPVLGPAPVPIQKQVATLPTGPGVYVFKDASGSVIYVGKARNLRRRVRQYFTTSQHDGRFFAEYVRRNTAAVETLSTGSEGEALILENNLIKEHRPKFNIRLRDDKDYLCIRLDLREEWPRLELVRRPLKDGARYFGPYHSGQYLKQLYRFISIHFGLRTCSNTILKSRTRPCLKYQIGRCLAPCSAQTVDRDAYMKNVADLMMMLEGKTAELRARLVEEMRMKSEAMEYEAAARIRDLIAALDSLEVGRRVVDVDRADIDTDVAGFAREMDRVAVTVMFIRSGKVIGVWSDRFSNVAEGDEEAMRSFLSQYYGMDRYIPAEILLPMRLPDQGVIEEVLRAAKGGEVRLLTPRKGKGLALVKMAVENAREELRRWERMESGAENRLLYLASRLRLRRMPQKIECIDIAHTTGREVTGSIVVMEGGEMRKSLYKRFKIKAAAGGDDFAAMREVISRRFARAVAGEKGWELPDLLLIDGGRAHLKLAALLREEMGLGNLELAAIAKDKKREEKVLLRRRIRERLAKEGKEGGEQVPPIAAEAPAADETGKQSQPELVAASTRTGTGYDIIYIEGQKEGIPATKSTPLALLVKLRDEAHRFALAYHKKLRGRGTIRSVLLEVQGVGPRTVSKLLRTFKGLGVVRATPEEEIASKVGISLSVVRRIKEKLKSHSIDTKTQLPGSGNGLPQ